MSEPDDLFVRLGRGEIVGLPRLAWEALCPRFEELLRRDTDVAGLILVVRGPSGIAAVEEPSRELRVVRPLASEAAAQAFIDKRLAQYDRMWDGCGFRIDYYR
ncbi:MAG: hypothetical protein HY908_06345 [Myxococcales bacterium]|nr:hypothetical protein [Myxococcales bacterium]